MERNIIKEIMTERNLTYTQISKMSGINISQIWKIANRELGMSYRMAYKISKVFNIDLDEIINVEMPKR